MSQLNSAVWAPPRWRAPVGLGENRVRTSDMLPSFKTIGLFTIILRPWPGNFPGGKRVGAGYWATLPSSSPANSLTPGAPASFGEIELPPKAKTVTRYDVSLKRSRRRQDSAPEMPMPKKPQPSKPKNHDWSQLSDPEHPGRGNYCGPGGADHRIQPGGREIDRL